MSSIKNIKYKDNCLDKTIKQILNIHDSNITFPKGTVSKKVHDRMATVFTGRLSYSSPRCECCGYHSVIHHGYKDSWIQLLPYQEVSTYLHLYKQRFYYKHCHHTFSAKTYHVAENYYLSQPLKFAIAVDLMKTTRFDLEPNYFIYVRKNYTRSGQVSEFETELWC